MINIAFDLYCRVRYGIKIYRNVLTEKDRLTLLEESKKHLMIISSVHPGLQTSADLHQRIKHECYLIICKLMNKMKFKSIHQCWSVYNDPDHTKEVWHCHHIKSTSIYYMENPEELGTIFRVKGKEFQINVPTNTLMGIPGNIEHTGPIVTKPRQCIVIDTDE